LYHSLSAAEVVCSTHTENPKTNKMKCIIKAMTETQYRPRAKWWGYIVNDKRYLCRYNHCFAIFSSTKVLFADYETVTDKRGVDFAIDYFLSSKKTNKNKLT